MKYVGIDLGGTNIAVGIVDENGNLLFQNSTPTLPVHGQDDVIQRIADAVLNLIHQSALSTNDIVSVGIGCPGSIDKTTGTVLSACNLGFQNAPIVTKLQELLGLPVYIENDANCAALAEATVGAASHAQSSVTITLGTGIGSGLVINGQLYGGFNGFGGELGHTVICADDELCTCGAKGCFEAYASATALARDTYRAAQKNPKSLLWTYRDSDGTFSAKTAFEAAKCGDITAQTVIAHYIKYLSIGLVNIIKILQPEIIVIGGGVSAAGDALLKPLVKAVHSAAYNKWVSSEQKTKIVIAKLGNSAGIIGASMLGKDKGKKS